MSLAEPMTDDALARALATLDGRIWSALRLRTDAARGAAELLHLSRVRREARRRGIAGGPEGSALRLAIVGGVTLYPLHELTSHVLELAGQPCEVFTGQFDQHAAEILGRGELRDFRPDVVWLFPSPREASYTGSLGDPEATVRAVVDERVEALFGLCRAVHDATGAAVLVSNFAPPAESDLGAFRSRTPASAWSFTRYINLELGRRAPPFVAICDVEFLAASRGTAACHDARAWYESKQPGAYDFVAAIAREAAVVIGQLRTVPKKVLVTDLDNTLWGGILAEDGISGIEVGSTSPRAEAYAAFQAYLRRLAARGVLLAVCTKSERARALEAFRDHPEMPLRPEDFVAFKAGPVPKPEGLREIAADLGLDLGSMAFVDDDPSEIGMVREWLPEVETLLVPDDPAELPAALMATRWFDPRVLTPEDEQRTRQYRDEALRGAARGAAIDLETYRRALAMRAELRSIVALDAARVAQLAGRTNQFNATLRRRTQGEIEAWIARPGAVAFSARLADKFGDQGLVAAVLGCARGATLELDVWVMSCRAMERQLEDVTLNELVRRAHARGCRVIELPFVRGPRNHHMVELLSRLGFEGVIPGADRTVLRLEVASYRPRSTSIEVTTDGRPANPPGFGGDL